MSRVPGATDPIFIRHELQELRTEIADKALICYRCGEATAVATRPAPAPVRKRGAGLMPLVTLLVLIFAALFLGQAGRWNIPPVLSYTIAVLAALVLLWRIWRRRAGRR